MKNGVSASALYETLIKNGKSNAVSALAIPSYAPIIGKSDAKVVVQIFTEFQCPYCKRAAVDIPEHVVVDENGESRTLLKVVAGLKKTIEKFGDQVKFVFRNMPLEFHPRENHG
jgi:protein-disulfide isomerase